MSDVVFLKVIKALNPCDLLGQLSGCRLEFYVDPLNFD